MKPVSVLCCARQSVYHSLVGVECFDTRRDVRTFDGSTAIVAHPPCAPWSAFCSHQWKPVEGIREIGPLCVEWLKRCGGILEHPAHSRLFAHCDLPRPGDLPRPDGLWTAEVLQAWWGYSMTKRTWLVFSGITPDQVTFPFFDHDPRGDRRRQQVMSKNQRAATHPALAQWLIDHARKAIKPPTPSLP